jgi:replication fork clamp-binding protein CrfC
VFRNFCIFIGSIFVILFFALFFSGYTGYYDYSNGKKNILTNSAIERFENDLKLGKNMDSSSYLEKEKDYNNKLSRLGIKTSNIIEKLFEKGINVIFKELNKVVSVSATAALLEKVGNSYKVAFQEKHKYKSEDGKYKECVDVIYLERKNSKGGN